MQFELIFFLNDQFLQIKNISWRRAPQQKQKSESLDFFFSSSENLLFFSIIYFAGMLFLHDEVLPENTNNLKTLNFIK